MILQRILIGVVGFAVVGYTVGSSLKPHPAPEVAAPLTAPAQVAITPRRQVLTAPTVVPVSMPSVKIVRAQPEARTPVISGISEDRRRGIFEEIVDAEDRAQKEADARYSYDSSINRNLEENQRLTTKYRSEVQRQHKLSDSAFQAIGDEGVENQWPPLKPLKKQGE